MFETAVKKDSTLPIASLISTIKRTVQNKGMTLDLDAPRGGLKGFSSVAMSFSLSIPGLLSEVSDNASLRREIIKSLEFTQMRLAQLQTEIRALS